MDEVSGILARPDGQDLAWRRIPGEGPTVLWLGGFNSDMTGTKAEALKTWAQATGRPFLRFDYFGHGESRGAFQAGTISRWREDALAVLDTLTRGEVLLVGSSMGAWLACLLALVRADRVKALVLLAPAIDFTDKLLAPSLPQSARDDLAQTGVWMRPSEFGAPYPITRTLLEDGAQWSLLPGPIPIRVPVRIIQGQSDADVPWTHAMALAAALPGPDLVTTLIRDGDHRLSRPQDLSRLIAAVEAVI